MTTTLTLRSLADLTSGDAGGNPRSAAGTPANGRGSSPSRSGTQPAADV